MGQVYDQNTGLYYYNARFYDPQDGRFLTQDTYRGAKNNPDTLHLYVYCYNNPIINTDPSGHWVYSIGVEGQAAIGVGVYGGYAFNLDSKGKVSLTASAGLLAIANVGASFAGYVAGYSKYKSVKSIEGWGISAGVAFSTGYKISGSGGISVSPNGKMSVAGCVSYGVGVSIMPVPYLEVKVGETWGIHYFDIHKVFCWKKGKSKNYKRGGLSYSITRKKNKIRIYSKAVKRGFSVYPKKKQKKKKWKVKKVSVN